MLVATHSGTHKVSNAHNWNVEHTMDAVILAHIAANSFECV